jgi:hypothetical protein
MLYCAQCKRIYFLPSNNTYLCNQEGNFGLPPNEPWAIPEVVDFDSSARTFNCLFSTCDSPTRRHPSWRHNFALMTRGDVIQKYKDSVLLEVQS